MKLTFCVACGATDDLHHHHLIPRVEGGTDNEINLITLCARCHRTLHEHRRRSYNHRQLTIAGLAAKKRREKDWEIRD
jgi:5-methylcytosine-specific restriction endonuclease McrA